jgi:hypothetical protein
MRQIRAKVQRVRKPVSRRPPGTASLDKRAHALRAGQGMSQTLVSAWVATRCATEPSG